MNTIDYTKTISVITICYNPGTEIIKTLESVLAQDCSDFEYLIQDGGSSDGTLKVFEEYKERFAAKSIDFRIESGKDSGIYDAMNKAVARVKGSYVNFMNAGDCFYSEKVLSNICAFKAKNQNTDVFYGDAVECEYGRFYLFRKSFAEIQSRMPFSHQSAFVRRELLSKYPFRQEYRIGADYDFLLTLHENGCNFKDSGEIICIVTKDGVSSLKLYDTYLETIELRKNHGITPPAEEELKKAIRVMKIKQLVMDYFPDFVKKAIRYYQLKKRGQMAELILPPWI